MVDCSNACSGGSTRPIEPLHVTNDIFDALLLSLLLQIAFTSDKLLDVVSFEHENKMTMMEFTRNDLLHYIDPTSLHGALVYGIIFFGLALFAARLVRISLKRSRKFFPDTSEAIFVSQLLQVIIYVVALILYAHLIPALRSLGTALLTGASVVSLVVGLASQSSIGNLVAGFSIFLFRRFKIGDRLQINTPKGMATGMVEAMTLGYTTLRTAENEEIMVPNNMMINSIIIRISPKSHGD